MLMCSAKSGLGVEEILPAIIERIPPPPAQPEGQFHALLFDSWYDEYRGVVALVEVSMADA